ncbi:MAG: hypothetical protein H0W69_02180 [Gemmatimonadaceae bacterium]|nr:hypothetical protein [Gemmatimonadaceae bacterium]
MRILSLSALLLASSIANAQPGTGVTQPERAQVEKQLRARMGEVVKQRLGLNPQQMQQLKAANRRFDSDRLVLLSQERRVRMEIRQQIEAGDKASQDRISALMDSTLLLERRRLDLMESEQNELKKFLTPIQRAQYFGLQTQIRSRMEQMRRNRAPGARRRPPQ